jgi:hypothetical protein
VPSLLLPRLPFPSPSRELRPDHHLACIGPARPRLGGDGPRRPAPVATNSLWRYIMRKLIVLTFMLAVLLGTAGSAMGGMSDGADHATITK